MSVGIGVLWAVVLCAGCVAVCPRSAFLGSRGKEDRKETGQRGETVGTFFTVGIAGASKTLRAGGPKTAGGGFTAGSRGKEGRKDTGRKGEPITVWQEPYPFPLNTKYSGKYSKRKKLNTGT